MGRGRGRGRPKGKLIHDAILVQKIKLKLDKLISIKM